MIGFNMKETKNYFLISGILFIAFIIFTVMVSFVDVQAIGPQNSEVGLASINKPVADGLAYNKAMYDISEVLGYFAIFTVGIFGLFGAMQLFIKKGFSKVDKDLYALAGMYACVLASYVLFEKLVINFRPVILEEGLEASYPSSHTMMSVAFMLAAMQQFSMRLKKNAMARVIIPIFCGIIGVGIIVTRLLSGVHWFTDIIGGVLLASAWFMLYYAIIRTIYKDKFNSK